MQQDQSAAAGDVAHRLAGLRAAAASGFSVQFRPGSGPSETARRMHFDRWNGRMRAWQQHTHMSCLELHVLRTRAAAVYMDGTHIYIYINNVVVRDLALV